MRLLTIASASYIPLAATLFESAKKIHPELIPTLLVADVSREGLMQLQEQGADSIGSLLCVEDLGFEPLDSMRAYYNPLEYCCALKILGMAHILKSESDCLFLDSDMLVLDRLDALLDFPGDTLVTPHILGPLPDDGFLPDDLELCGAGFINGGILRARAGAPALPWLISKMKTQWFVAPHLAMYADQLWLSAMPFLFSRTHVLKSPGVNVAYWNLHERPLRWRDGKAVLASGEALSLFHFSGFPRPNDGRLSAYSERRFDSETEKVIAVLVQDYAARLQDATMRWGHLKGDIPFTRDPLTIRINRAADLWGDSRLRPARTGIRARLRALLGQ